MPIVLAPLVSFLLGVVFAWVAREDLLRPGRARSSLVRVSAFAAFVLAPVVAYTPTFHGDWSYLYLVSSDRVPSAVDLLLVALSVASCLVGHGAALRAVTGRRLDRVVWLALSAFLALALATALTSRRLAVVGSTAQYRSTFGLVALAQSRLARGLALSWVAIFAALGIGAWWSRRVR